MQSIITQFYTYVNSLLDVVSSSKEDIDTAIKLGYSWKRGPFEMMASSSDLLLSRRSVAKMEANSGISGQQSELSHEIPETRNARSRMTSGRKILQNPSAYLYQPTPGTLIFSLQTKMNTLDENAFNLLIGSIDYAEKHKAEKLIIYNEGKHFSAGANLNLFLEMGKRKDTKAIEKLLELGQKAMLRVKYSKVPVIACAKGVALGGGCELLLHAHKVFAHLDLSAGLVEVGVGLIPGWGGIKEMVLRGNGDNDKIIKNLHNIFAQNKSSSAYWFESDYMIKDLEVVMNEDKLLERAMACDALPSTMRIDNNNTCKIDLISACSDLKLDDHTIFIAKALQDEINSASLLEEKILEIERKVFKKLLAMPATLEKIRKVV